MTDWGMAFYVFFVGIAGVGFTLAILEVCTWLMSVVVKRVAPADDTGKGDET